MPALLEITNLNKRFAGVSAVSGLSLSITEGEVRGIIGPNGSGKTTLFNLISGVHRADEGSRIVFAGEDIVACPPHEIAARGLARTFQMLRLFSAMTVIENLQIGAHCRVRAGPLSTMLGLRSQRAEEQRLRAEMMELLGFLGLADYADMPAEELSIGQRRLLALGRCVAMRPKLLMLDEPAAGLSPANVDNLLATVFVLKQRLGLTVVIIEHILKVVMEGCDIVTVLDHGTKICEGPPAQVKNDPGVIEAYLGQEMNDAEMRALFRNG